MQRNFFLIESYDEKLNEWRVETGFVFDTLEEAKQTLFATFDYHQTPGQYRIIEVEKYQEIMNLTIANSA
ncbi:MAG: hypothetical protein KHX48_01525 [Alistipes sp.]|nr:hypothetical protein [Alistipes sp.]